MTALRLAVAMLGFQASIGAINDVVDADHDRVSKPAKPLVTGGISRRMALVWAAASFTMGLLLAAASGPATALVGVVGAALGWAYDVRLSRTPFSWLPLALALPLAPVFAWLGATGTVPAGLGGLAVTAVFAGAGLMIGNGLVDLERDEASAKATVAVAMGRRRSWLIHAGAIAIAVALAWLLAPSANGGTALTTIRSIGLPLGTAAILLGAGLLSARSPRTRERGWEVEVLGVAALGLAWLAGTASALG